MIFYCVAVIVRTTCSYHFGALCLQSGVVPISNHMDGIGFSYCWCKFSLITREQEGQEGARVL